VHVSCPANHIQLPTSSRKYFIPSPSFQQELCRILAIDHHRNTSSANMEQCALVLFPASRDIANDKESEKHQYRETSSDKTFITSFTRCHSVCTTNIFESVTQLTDGSQNFSRNYNSKQVNFFVTFFLPRLRH
jgi:hypothetical protein